jgi:hypothetical protein
MAEEQIKQDKIEKIIKIIESHETIKNQIIKQLKENYPNYTDNDISNNSIIKNIEEKIKNLIDEREQLAKELGIPDLEENNKEEITQEESNETPISNQFNTAANFIKSIDLKNKLERIKEEKSKEYEEEYQKLAKNINDKLEDYINCMKYINIDIKKMIKDIHGFDTDLI